MSVICLRMSLANFSYAVVPPTLLGRFAVDRRHHGHGIGEFLMMDALGRVHEQSSQIGTVAVIVDAIDQKAIQFYKQYDFIPFPERPARLCCRSKRSRLCFAIYNPDPSRKIHVAYSNARRC